MIDARELRIGNLVYKHFNVYKISLITFQEEREQAYYFKELEPIPLTEELLVMFGFEKFKSSDLGDFEYHKFISGSEYLVWFSDYSMAIGGSKDETNKGLCFCSNCIFKHVHQIQNLYFALTGIELELK